MNEKLKKWQAELDHAIEVKKELNAIYDAKIKELKQKIAEAQEEIKKDQEQKVANMVRGVYGELTPETVGKLKELLEIAEPPAGEQ